MEASSTAISIAYIPILIYLGFFVFVIYSIITCLKLMKERNDHLREIRDELRKSNRDSY